ncbi:MAG: hypothetical protein HFE34_01790 [Clostridia bacterium]|jgi:hypothetical protein|nr:hypothetical protein [Clostridia bacterium]
MEESKKKIIKQSVMIAVATVFIILGILSIIQATGSNAGLGYISAIPNVILKYAVVIITNAIGIMLMSTSAGTFEGKVKNIFSIAVCAYSTIMTVPLLLAFVLMFPVGAGSTLPAFLDDMVREIVVAFQDLVGNNGWQFVIYTLGVIMSVIFLALPILSTYCTVKEIDLIKLIKEKTNKKDRV